MLRRAARGLTHKVRVYILATFPGCSPVRIPHVQKRSEISAEDFLAPVSRRLSSGHQDGLKLQRLPRRVVAQDVVPRVPKVRPRARSGVVARSVSPSLGRSVGIQPAHVDVLTQHARAVFTHSFFNESGGNNFGQGVGQTASIGRLRSRHALKGSFACLTSRQAIAGLLGQAA